MKIVFMGTPDFSVSCLKILIEQNHDVVAVFTKPDKPVGRKQVLTPSAVKLAALAKGICVYQPNNLKDDETASLISSFSPDVIIVVAYGQILTKNILNIAKYGCINVHASILPKYRGAAPIQWAILNGDKETGVTIMQMDEGIDTGNILSIKKTDIDINETSEQLFERLSIIGAEALCETLDNIDSVKPIPQLLNDGSYVKKITKELSPIDWNKSAQNVHNQIRGLQSWPCATTKLNGKTLKVHRSALSDKTGLNAGGIVDNKDTLTVCCGDGKCVELLELQLEGKKRMDTKTFLLGNNIKIGTILGE